MEYPKPPESKSAVRRAGREIADDKATAESYEVLDQWRLSHGYVINTFQAWIKGHIQKVGFEIEFAQRLKRKKTVIDKLKRKRADNSPLISDVTSMHDFAGCRMIFANIAELKEFRNYMRSKEVLRNVYHKLKHDESKYDYIERPKSTGYRGVHDVYSHVPRKHRRKEERVGYWDGLMVEIQYRTRAQHAWATAVEISDVIDGEKTKFELQSSERGLFFAIASEIIARKHEGVTRAFVDKNDDELIGDIKKLESKLNILQRLRLLRQIGDENKLKKHNVLSVMKSEAGELKLEIDSFNSAAKAIARSTELENNPEIINAVYVRSDNKAQIRSAYRNYFNDPVDFVQLIGI